MLHLIVSFDYFDKICVVLVVKKAIATLEDPDQLCQCRDVYEEGKARLNLIVNIIVSKWNFMVIICRLMKNDEN
jgi:hypothetical protein